MKTKCKTLKLSIFISISSFVLFSVFFFLNKYNNNIWFQYVYNISLGLFGSSFVVFLISIAEYNVAKTQLLEKIWNESRKLNMQLYKIRPIYSSIDYNLLTDYITEWLSRQNKKDKILFGDKHDAYDKIYNYLFEYHKEDIDNVSNKEIKLYIDSLIDNERNKMLNQLEEVIDQYLNINNYSFTELNNLLGDVQFFTGEKQYLQLYKKIYQPLKKMYDDLNKYVCYHFQLYRKGETNRQDVLLGITLKHQNKLFKIEKNSEWDMIFAHFCDDMDDKIEEFRANTIYKCKVEKIEHNPIETIYHNINEK